MHKSVWCTVTSIHMELWITTFNSFCHQLHVALTWDFGLNCASEVDRESRRGNPCVLGFPSTSGRGFGQRRSGCRWWWTRCTTPAPVNHKESVLKGCIVCVWMIYHRCHSFIRKETLFSPYLDLIFPHKDTCVKATVVSEELKQHDDRHITKLQTLPLFIDTIVTEMQKINQITSVFYFAPHPADLYLQTSLWIFSECFHSWTDSCLHYSS